MRVHFIAPLLLAFFIPCAHGEKNTQSIEQHAQHQQEQEKARYNQLETQGKDVRATGHDTSNAKIVFPVEAGCFEIRQVILNKDDKIPYWLSLQKIIVQAENQCLGIEGIRILATVIQNKLIGYGYITTRVIIPRQNLKEGVLMLTILPGIVGNITFSEKSDKYTNLYTAFPSHKGDILDLRAVEQGLENIQRVPGADANVILRPGEDAGRSDIEIERTQPSFWRIGGWFDDAGSKYTGRYQSGVAFYLDNPTSLNDLFYISVGRDLHFQKWRNSKNASLYYSVPYGFWSVDVYASHNEYLQRISGIWTDFQYQGKSNNLSLKVNRLLYRNANHKTTLSVQLLKNHSLYYLNDTKIYNQERDVTNVITRLNHRHYTHQSIFDAMVSYQHNTSWFGAQQQAGTNSKNRIISLDLSALIPFILFEQSMSYQPRYRQQYSPDQLFTQDQFSIGNRWSVRGFDGELNLSAKQGYSLRNDINLNLSKLNQQPYVGIDYGRIWGSNGHFTAGHLAGGVIGVRGIVAAHLSYDVFAGVPLYKPENFDTSPANLGVTLQWEF